MFHACAQPTLASSFAAGLLLDLDTEYSGWWKAAQSEIISAMLALCQTLPVVDAGGALSPERRAGQQLQ